ncbi:MAG: hypothetical protein Q9O62_10945 [Ardenticatenia bacterium]|nr:hypothetical protein [Ardenticatenia bacterium]
MIDRIVVPPSVHIAAGGVLFLVAAAALVLTALEARRRHPLSRTTVSVLAALQLLLLAQTLIGIKLLDQGHGVRQLYIHYVGGFAPIGLYLVLSWLPLRDEVRRTYATAAVTGLTFVFVLLTFAVGSMYVNG